MSMSERMKELRLNRRLTLEQVGNIIGVSRATVSKYENGECSNMKRENIKKLADYYGVSPTYLMGYDDEQEEKEALLEGLRMDSDTRLLFSAAKGATPDQIRKAAEILLMLKGNK